MSKCDYWRQGDRTRNVGIVDSEYIAHFGLPTLGGSKNNEASDLIVENNSYCFSLMMNAIIIIFKVMFEWINLKGESNF